MEGATWLSVWSEKDLVRRAKRRLAVLQHAEEVSGDVEGDQLMVQLICPRRFEPRSCELRGRIGGHPERFILCGADVTEVNVSAFNVVEVVDVIGHGGG